MCWRTPVTTCSTSGAFGAVRSSRLSIGGSVRRPLQSAKVRDKCTSAGIKVSGTVLVMRHSPAIRLSRLLATFALLMLAACGPVSTAPAIVVAAPTTGMVAVTARGSANVRLLYAREGSIVLLRTVHLPPGDAVQSV